MKNMVMGLLLLTFSVARAETIKVLSDDFVLEGVAGGTTENLFLDFEKACLTFLPAPKCIPLDESSSAHPFANGMLFSMIKAVRSSVAGTPEQYTITFKNSIFYNSIKSDGTSVVLAGDSVPSAIIEKLIYAGGKIGTDSNLNLVSVTMHDGIVCDSIGCHFPNVIIVH